MSQRYLTGTCLRKRRDASKHEAHQQLMQWVAMGFPRDDRVAYGCICGGGHIGHRRKAMRGRS
jgi:hypothetical protein